MEINACTTVSFSILRADIDASWSRGVKMAEGQNFARFLKESPANKMTPTIFCEEAKKNLGSLPNVTVTVQ